MSWKLPQPEFPGTTFTETSKDPQETKMRWRKYKSRTGFSRGQLLSKIN